MSRIRQLTPEKDVLLDVLAKNILSTQCLVGGYILDTLNMQRLPDKILQTGGFCSNIVSGLLAFFQERMEVIVSEAVTDSK